MLAEHNCYIKKLTVTVNPLKKVNQKHFKKYLNIQTCLKKTKEKQRQEIFVELNHFY
jgi:hypothetical protein